MSISHYCLASAFLVLLFALNQAPAAAGCTGLSGAPSVPTSGGGGNGGGDVQSKCLHIEAPVLMADGSVQKAADLRVGDRVLNEDGQATPVVLTPVADMEAAQSFVRFHTDTGREVTVTPDHAVFARPCGMKETDWPIKRSIDLTIGECVPVLDGEDQVMSIRSVDLVGRIQPITQNGKIVVDGVVLSCYDFSHQNDTQEERHAPFEPMRLFYDLAEKIYNTISNEEYALGVIKSLIKSAGLENLYCK